MMLRIVCKKLSFPCMTIWHKGKKYKTPWLGYTKSPLIKANDSSVHSNKKGFTISQPQKEMEQFIENVPYNPDLLDLMITDDEIQQQAVSILSALNDKERTLYILHYRQKLKLKEIAKQQNIQEATVRKQHQRLKKKLLKMIKNL